MLVIYGFVASVLPVWLLLAPRDYLSTFMKIGVIIGLAIGIVFAMPEMKMPAVSRFIDGSGPVFAGALFPFLFITTPAAPFPASTRWSPAAPRPSLWNAKATFALSVTAPC